VVVGAAQCVGGVADLADGGAFVGADDLAFVEEDDGMGDVFQHGGQVGRQARAGAFDPLGLIDDERARLAGGAAGMALATGRCGVGFGLGTASSGERERRRDRDGQWTAAAAARVAHCLREQTQRCLTGTPWVQMTLALNMNNVVTELYAVLLFSDLADTSDKPVAIERDVPVTLGK
jgi:hypothetical protein